jgi:hypothetical protein
MHTFKAVSLVSRALRAVQPLIFARRVAKALKPSKQANLGSSDATKLADEVECPLCGARVSLGKINLQIDNGCKETAAAQSTKVQKSMQSFFGGQDTTVPDFFVLRRSPETGCLVASFERKNPLSGPMWSAAIEMKEIKPFRVVTDLVPGTQSGPVQLPPFHFKNVPFLKSHLQKSMRRNRADLAVATTATLLQLDYRELIRRLPIIVLEDAAPMSTITILVWLMLAEYKGYSLPTELIPEFLGIVQLHTESPIADKGWEGVADPDAKAIRKLVDRIESASMPRWSKDLLWALRIRVGYGGMPGDVKMLGKTMFVLFDRFSKGQPADLEKTFLVGEIPLVADVPELTKDNFLLNAVDFHVSKRILSDLSDLHDLSEDTIKEVLWIASSGVNARLLAKDWKDGSWVEPRTYDVPEDLASDWAKMEKDFMKLARDTLNHQG